jgi:hypothetical protein
MRSHRAAGSRVKSASQAVVQRETICLHGGGLRLAGSRDRSVNSQGYGTGKPKLRPHGLGKRERASCVSRLSDTAEASDFSHPPILTSLRACCVRDGHSS